MSKLNKRHLKNLEKLANFLEKKVTNKQFKMDDFRQNKNGVSCEFVSNKSCGTIGCALGWAPFKIPAKRGHFNNDSVGFKYLDFDLYARLTFGCSVGDCSAGDYMFSGEWYDNKKQRTRLATVKRIREIITSKGKISDKMESRCPAHISVDRDASYYCTRTKSVYNEHTLAC